MPSAPIASSLDSPPFLRIIQKLNDLLQQNHQKILLLGAGCSKAAGLPLTSELTDTILGCPTLETKTAHALSSIQNNFDGAHKTTIEDFLSELIDLLAIAERRNSKGAPAKPIQLGGKNYTSQELRAAADEIKEEIAKAISADVDIEVHRDFVRAVHSPIRTGRVKPFQDATYIVLNYDTTIEDALALEMIPFSDGMDGGVTGWWNPSVFDREDLAAKVIKLHGSINWRELPHDLLPRRVAERLKLADPGDRRILIWPASTKYRETQLDPFAQLTHRARLALRPPAGGQRLLVVCGYSFGDTHINLEIERALRESAGDLTTVAFTSDNAPSGQLKDWHRDPEISQQLLIYANRGFFHADVAEVATSDLPWWRFETVTKILRGEI